MTEVASSNRRSFTGIQRKSNASWRGAAAALEPAFLYRDTAEKERRLGLIKPAFLTAGWAR
jgi:hypothetical protein